MGMIDLSFLSERVSELNFFFTNLARSEQMKDTVKEEIFEEDVSSTTVEVSFSDNKVSLSLNTNDNNKLHIWKENFYIMAKALLPQKFIELISSCKEYLIEQFKPIFMPVLTGGVS